MDKSAPPPGFVTGPGFGPPPPPHMMPPGPGIGHPPPPPPYNEGTNNIVIVGPVAFGSEPQRMTCPHCHSSISTTVEAEVTSKTHLFALILCLLGLWCCVPCPYCMDSCMTKKHFCPSCKAFLGQSMS